MYKNIKMIRSGLHFRNMLSEFESDPADVDRNQME